jgi:hypothetical protein
LPAGVKSDTKKFHGRQYTMQVIMPFDMDKKANGVAIFLHNEKPVL